MKRICLLLALLPGAAMAQQSSNRFADDLDFWKKPSKGQTYARYEVGQFREIADNILAYQNEDGGWPKNLDMRAMLDPDSVVLALKPHSRRSTLDNNATYTQIEYLAEAYTATGDERYRDGARQGIEYMLATQYPNGGWRGWDADALTFNDGVMCGVLSAWLDVLKNKPYYTWVDKELKKRIRASWERGLDAVLRTQYVRDGVKTVWAQQYDHETLVPVKARAYELPGLAAGESAGIVLLLMRISKPSPEVVEAVKAAVAWFEATKIVGKKVVTVKLAPEQREDPSIAVDRIVVDDPQAPPMWARYYELDTDEIFMCRRDGVKVYRLCDVPAERRVGYAWYGPWGNSVLAKYPAWLAKIEK